MSVPQPATRKPQQDRSRASHERMLQAARKLMVKRGNADFTLNEVAKAGKVSIGSIYLRFDSKDDLIAVVQGGILGEIDAAETKLLADVTARATGLREFVSLLIEAYGEMLSRFAPQLRPLMVHAMSDTRISGMGSRSHDRFAEAVKREILTYKEELKRPDPEQSVDSAWRVIYATFARYLGLGSSPEAAGQGDWVQLKRHLAEMCSAFLLARDQTG